jgi:hypothetical protein
LARFATSRERYEAVKEEVAGAVIGLLEQRFPGLANFYMAGQWAEGMIGVSPAADFRVDKLEGDDKRGAYLRLRVFIDPDTVAPAGRFLDLERHGGQERHSAPPG